MFQVLDTADGEAIAADLERLEAEPLPPGADPTLRRVTFFAERHLWADALGEAFAASNPSDAVMQYREAVYAHLCN